MNHAGLFRQIPRRWFIVALAAALIAISIWGIANRLQRRFQPLTVARHGDEIILCGQFFRIGTPVILWTDPGGYSGYPPRSASATRPTSAVFGSRDDLLDPVELIRVHQHGWDLALLQTKVQQFVIHYDASGTSRECFAMLRSRGLSVHFLLDLDGTIYQTLDLRERAWHATTANSRSIGIEIANRGAVPTPTLLDEWYTRDALGLRVTVPARFGDSGIRTPGFIARPATPHLVRGNVQGQWLYQYDFTNAQYESLARLTAALCTVLPRIRCDYPRDAEGPLITVKLDDEVLSTYQGLLGHYHVQRDKQDPGPAFQWDRVVKEAQQIMARQSADSIATEMNSN